MDALKNWVRRYQLGSLLLLVLLLAVILPLTLDIFRLNLVGKYLCYAFVAVGLVMVWGYGGVLSLGQGVFFGLGGYAMAMFLKLEASDPESTKIQSTPGIPDFMDWNQITELPAIWLPFKSLPLTLLAVVLVPMALAWLISFGMFKRRVGGVYFAIITQAVALILTVLIIGQQGYTGGVNGGINFGLGNMFNYNGPMLMIASLIHDSDKPADSILTAIDAVIEDLRTRPVDAATLERARTKARSNFYSYLEALGGFGRADLLAVFALFDSDPARINRLEAEFAKVTPELIMRTAQEYLRPTNRTVLTIEPRKPTP